MDGGGEDVLARLLYGRPGFKLRRAHQIAQSVFASAFAEESRGMEVTSTQFGILLVLRHRRGLDQNALAAALGLDRSTTGQVVALLESRGLLRRAPDAADRRRRLLALTAEGEMLLERLAPLAEQARARLLAPLSAEEAATLDTLLDRLLRHHDEAVRVPLRRDAGAPDGT